MGAHIGDNIFLMREPKAFYFDFNFLKDVDKNMKPKIKFIIKTK